MFIIRPSFGLTTHVETSEIQKDTNETDTHTAQQSKSRTCSLWSAFCRLIGSRGRRQRSSEVALPVRFTIKHLLDFYDEQENRIYLYSSC